MNTCWVRYTKALDMEKALTPNRLDVDPSSPNTAKEFNHWLKTFTYFLGVLPKEGLDKLSVLINFVSAHVYDYIIDCETYEEAIHVLKSLFVKAQNEVYARHMLLSRKQNPGETLDEYLQALKAIAKDCCFKSVDATTYCNEVVRDVFIAGLRSDYVTQKLLDNKSLDVSAALRQAKRLDPNEESVDVKTPSLSSEANGDTNHENDTSNDNNNNNVHINNNNNNNNKNNSHNNNPDSSSDEEEEEDNEAGVFAPIDPQLTCPNMEDPVPIKKNRRKNGNIRNHRPNNHRVDIDTKNIIPSTMNTRRKRNSNGGPIRETRLRAAAAVTAVKPKNKLIAVKPILRRIHSNKIDSRPHSRLEPRSHKQTVSEEDWRHRFSFDLLKRRSHRMRKPPERLDW